MNVINGGFAPNLESNEEAMEVILEAITRAGYRLLTTALPPRNGVGLITIHKHCEQD